ncbi:PTS sugar transporter subunit IIC [Candidatus Enterococcus murrayae]|uniref:Permease IIC component n=1 Tax=Candidatus Enterococcus murrayae TaxID=2815321 RepID=A0ABS3HDM8_9ENTE|nr:PTS transporter subunit EIIC [Enterococcus sp. MJM16]MBO0451573.1 PTS sugar transporter subunit IIC [Enterococcus sp. MJM16]
MFRGKKSFATYFTDIVGKVAGNKFLLTLRDSFVLVSVTTMIAGFAIMVNSVFLDPAGGLLFSDSGLNLGKLFYGSTKVWLNSDVAAVLTNVQGIINLISQGSLSVFSLILVVVFSFIFSRNYFPKNSEHLTSVLYALGAFFICLPWNWEYTNGNETVSLENIVNSSFFGTQGVFSALVISGVAVWLYNKLLQSNIKLRFPDSVPPMVARSFESLIPGTITMAAFAIITGGITVLFSMTLPELLLDLLQRPAEFVSGTAAFAFISQFTWSLFQWFGIHPSSIWGAIFGVTWNVNDVQNIAGEAHHLYSTMFMNFSTISAGTFALAPVLATLIASRDQGARQVTKVGLMPAIFNISEPITFGLPIVMNPIYFIPFVIVQPLCFYIGVFFTKIGFIDVITNQVPWTVPPIISGLLFTGSVNGAIVQAINLLVATALYLPFIYTANRMNKQKNELE